VGGSNGSDDDGANATRGGIRVIVFSEDKEQQVDEVGKQDGELLANAQIQLLQQAEDRDHETNGEIVIGNSRGGSLVMGQSERGPEVTSEAWDKGHVLLWDKHPRSAPTPPVWPIITPHTAPNPPIKNLKIPK
jgi:hypothetical protein